MKNLPDGVIVSLPTPLLSFDKLDLEGLSNLLENLVSAGVSGISILGTQERSIVLTLRCEDL